MASILYSAIIVISSQTHSHLPRLVAIICIKNFTHSLWLNLMMAAIFNSAMLNSDTTIFWIQTPCYLLSDSLKNTLTPLWLWLKLIQSDSNSFILTYIDDGRNLEFCHPAFGHLGFIYPSISFQFHSHLPRLGPTICPTKLHSYILT